MASIKEKIQAEMGNIEAILVELEKVKDETDKEIVVLAGIGTFLQNIYTGMENILKQLLVHKNIPLPQSSSWHKDLLELAVEHGLISKATEDNIGRYLVFRHFFTHSYGFLLEEAVLQPLADNVFEIYSIFKKEIKDCLEYEHS